MLDKFLNDMIKYIEFLKSTYGLEISIHSVDSRMKRYLDKLYTYSTHNNPYCVFIKSNSEAAWNCVQKQEEVMERCKTKGSYYGMCYAGVEEYIVPVRSNDAYIAFISIGAFRSDDIKAKSKISSVAAKYGMDLKDLTKLYETILKENVPAKDLIDTVVYPISYMLELLYMSCSNYYGQHSYNTTELQNIYGNILNYIEWNYKWNINLERVCERFNCSKSFISHFFTKRTGKNFSNYVNYIRIREAKKLLLNTNISIKEISYRVGFTDSNYFSSVFKKECGMTPRTFRNNDEVNLHENLINS